MGHRCSNEDQQGDDDRSGSNDYKTVLLDLLLGSLFGSCRDPGQRDGTAAGSKSWRASSPTGS